MPGPNNERCGDCKKYINGFCHAKAPSPLLVEAETGAQYGLIWPPMGPDEFCFDDFEMKEFKEYEA